MQLYTYWYVLILDNTQYVHILRKAVIHWRCLRLHRGCNAREKLHKILFTILFSHGSSEWAIVANLCSPLATCFCVSSQHHELCHVQWRRGAIAPCSPLDPPLLYSSCKHNPYYKHVQLRTHLYIQMQITDICIDMYCMSLQIPPTSSVRDLQATLPLKATVTRMVTVINLHCFKHSSPACLSTGNIDLKKASLRHLQIRKLSGVLM